MDFLTPTGWALAALLLAAVALAVLALVSEHLTTSAPPAPVRISLHSLDDAQQETARLRPAPPPDLKHGGVVGRPRSVFLDGDGEWVGNLHR